MLKKHISPCWYNVCKRIKNYDQISTHKETDQKAPLSDGIHHSLREFNLILWGFSLFKRPFHLLSFKIHRDCKHAASKILNQFKTRTFSKDCQKFSTETKMSLYRRPHVRSAILSNNVLPQGSIWGSVISRNVVNPWADV